VSGAVPLLGVMDNSLDYFGRQLPFLRSALPSEGRRLGDLCTELSFSGSQLDYFASEWGSEGTRLGYLAFRRH
jgi:hypothetical protein